MPRSRRSLVVLFFLAVAVLFLPMSISPVFANHGWEVLSATCASGTLSYTIYLDASTGTSVYVQIDVNGSFLKGISPSAGGSTGNYTFTDSSGAYSGGATVRVYNTNGGSVGGPSSVTAKCDSGPVCLFNDGRMNCWADSAAQPVAIYCNKGGVDLWSVADSKGTFAFSVTKQEIDAVPANPEKNTLIKEAKGIALYRLHGGMLQVNGPNGYVYIWASC